MVSCHILLKRGSVTESFVKVGERVGCKRGDDIRL